MSYPVISKYFFKDLDNSISNLYYTKGLPFLAWSDLKSTNYDIIGRILDRINLNKSLLVSVGKTQAPFGMTVNPDNGTDLNKLLNSCKYSFVMTDKMAETDYILKCVLANITPICNLNHIFIKHLGLKSFATLNDFDNILDKLCEIKIKSHIFNYKTALLSWKYNRQLNKWHKRIKS